MDDSTFRKIKFLKTRNLASANEMIEKGHVPILTLTK